MIIVVKIQGLVFVGVGCLLAGIAALTALNLIEIKSYTVAAVTIASFALIYIFEGLRFCTQSH